MPLATVSLLALALVAADQPVVASETTTYTYDVFGRLIGSSATSGATVTSAVTTFDSADNRTNYAVSGVGGNPSSTFSIASGSANEGSPLTFTVTRGGATSGAVSVTYGTQDGSPPGAGSAVAGTNYVTKNGMLNFGTGVTSQAIAVTTVDDHVIAGSKTMSVVLSNPSGGTIQIGTATGTINNIDVPPPPSFAVSNAAAVLEGNPLIFTVNETGTLGASYTVNYATSSGNATAGTNYTSTNGTLTFQPGGATTQTITVPTIDDHVIDGPFNVTVTLSGPSGGSTITTSQASGTINDNDVQPPIANPVGFNIVECGASVPVNMTAGDSDPNGYAISVQSANLPNIPWTVVSASSIQFDAPGVSGDETGTYTIMNSAGKTATGTLTAHVRNQTCNLPAPGN